MVKKSIDDLAIFGVAPAFQEKLHVGKPNIGIRESLMRRMNDMLDRKWLSNNGPFVQELEQRVADLVGVKTLYTSAVEHIKEFGTVKAIGGSNLAIYWILGEQALIAAVIGFTLGAFFSYLARPLMAAIHLSVLLSPGFSAMVFAGTVVMCLGAALFSFRRVARIDPALVFRT